jgi:uncharacterized protein
MNAITKAGTGSRAVRSSVKILSILLGTTGIAALIGYGTALVFRLDAGNLISGVTKADRAPTDIPTSILNFIPSNLFEALSGNSAIPVVLIAVLIGISILTIRKNNSTLGEKFIRGVAGANELVMTITDYIIGFTPYGVLALIAKIASTKDYQSVLILLLFVVALYVAIFIMFAVHLLILAALNVNPVKYLRKVLPTLLFAFTSRSSAATLPMTIKTQIDLLGVDSTSANLSSAFWNYNRSEWMRRDLSRSGSDCDCQSTWLEYYEHWIFIALGFLYHDYFIWDRRRRRRSNECNDFASCSVWSSHRSCGDSDFCRFYCGYGSYRSECQ